MALIKLHSGAAGQATAGTDLLRDCGKERFAGKRIGIDKDQPIAARDPGAGITRTANLIERLKNHPGSSLPRNFRGPVSGIVVADDQFKVPSALHESIRSGNDFRKRTGEEFFLVERGDYH